MVTKSDWRKWATQQAWRGDSDATSSGIDRFLRMLDSPTVLTYSPMAGEPDVSHVPAAGRLLITRTPESGPLTVHDADAEREMHRWGFSQPVASAVPVSPELIDVVLVPAALFDRKGNRLGHGRGYYDRLLAACRPDVLRIGVTTVRAVVEILPVEPHDIVMTHLATESGVHLVPLT